MMQFHRQRVMINSFCLAAACLLLVDSVTASVFSANQSPTSQQTKLRELTVKRGLTAKLQFSHPDAGLKAIPDQSMDAEVLVRLERTGTDQRGYVYTLWFFGTVAGEYDLSKFVVTSDGSPFSASQSLPPMITKIVSDLPPDRGTNLYEIEDPALQAPGGYRAILITFAVLWFAVPVAWAYLRWKAAKPEPVPEVITAPTLSDRLRPLVQQASEGRLSVEEKSRLELLIYMFWQRKLSLPESLVDALPVMRRHAEAGGLLRSLEAWIHGESSSKTNLDSAKLEELLAPYQSTAAEEISLLDDNQRMNGSGPGESGATAVGSNAVDSNVVDSNVVGVTP